MTDGASNAAAGTPRGKAPTDQPIGRHLPGHIEAALLRAGEATDSAGQSWAGRDLSGGGNPLHHFDDDDGTADPGYLEAITALKAGSGTEQMVHEALAHARVFVPVVATLAEGGLGDHGFTEDKEADMALVTITAPDGRPALPVFSSVDRLQAWHGQARPVAVYAPRAALSAVAEKAQLLVIDPAAEATFVLRRPAMWALAQQQEWTPSYADETLLPLLQAAADADPAILGITAAPGRGVASRTADGTVMAGGGPGPELRVEVSLRSGMARDDVTDTVERLQRTLGADPEFGARVDSLELGLQGPPARA
ncbi:MAG: SseB family protein [Micrococcaceae bacterium]|nr:SseB family protein [Micrococcaceae bacterium]MDN5878057.1 SseB family protein [Micrococcaceae bacterium]MDN5885976.1 SseB family protein [Micrococcaceae bacterium]MDN5905625.1 SseB family protein [Micrococcaceae bacterium]MDN6299257.1 SseB family protein [Micrococcaceae bacterium]